MDGEMGGNQMQPQDYRSLGIGWIGMFSVVTNPDQTKPNSERSGERGICS